MERETLATYPLVSVRIACRNCKRRGSYRLARLAERYGADTTLEELLVKVTADCNLASNRTGRPGCRAAYFPDLDCPRRPPDRLREPLRMIAGGNPWRGEPVVYRKGELTKAQIDREWPHQFAVSAQFIGGRNHTIIDRFCRGLSVCPRHHYYERNGERYVVYCFAERIEADFFQVHFDGTLMDPTTRPRWPDHRQSAPSAEERHRNGRCVNCDD